MRIGAALLLLGGLSACEAKRPTTIDGSSSQAFEQTTEDARRDLPVADRLAFDSALRGVAGDRYSNKDPAATARAAFDGMTAAEVVATDRQGNSRSVP